MANKQHVEIVNQGASAWNNWRNRFDVFEADLSGIELSGADLAEIDFRRVNLQGTSLVGANLYVADLREADLREARLGGADLSRANLCGANLHGANLYGANLNQAHTDDANFDGIITGLTIFSYNDLSKTKGLENVDHISESVIGIQTLRLSKGKIPEIFLRGCGVSDLEIEFAKLQAQGLDHEEINKILYRMHDLRANRPIQISPLFISYSHADKAFVDRVEKSLNEQGIRFWRDIHDATAGRLETQIDRAITQNQTVLLILSENSIKSDWVQHEVRKARELEKEIKQDVLCPVALDDSWRTSPWPGRVMEQVKEYNILDFSNWHDDNKYKKTLDRLIDGLNIYYKK